MPVTVRSHCIKGTAASAEEPGPFPEKSSFRSQRLLGCELSQIVDAQLLLAPGDLIDDLEEAFVTEEFVFFLSEVLAGGIVFVRRDDE